MAHARLGETYPCKICGTPFVKDHGRRVTCSPECQREARDPTTEVRCTWCDHPMRQTIRDAVKGRQPCCSAPCIGAIGAFTAGNASSPWTPPRPPRLRKPKPEPFVPEWRDCLWCGERFATVCRSQVYCCSHHKVKAIRVRRRGRQYGSPSSFTLVEVMRVFALFGRRCAYCEQPITGRLPDPDHVVPLSRGGSNSITNILPSCHLCNSDKRDLLLAEWNDDRARRGLPPRIVDWPATDVRVAHLTVAGVAGLAA